MELKSVAHFVAELLAPHGYVTREPERDEFMHVVRFVRRKSDGVEIPAGAVAFPDTLLSSPPDRIEFAIRHTVHQAVKAAATEPALRA